MELRASAARPARGAGLLPELLQKRHHSLVVLVKVAWAWLCTSRNCSKAPTSNPSSGPSKSTLASNPLLKYLKVG